MVRQMLTHDYTGESSQPAQIGSQPANVHRTTLAIQCPDVCTVVGVGYPAS